MIIFDPTPCALGEGPLWHPLRGQLFWFDIVKFRLHTREGDATRTWSFDEHVSAAGWLDQDRLLIASETRLFAFNLKTGASEDVLPLEADRPDTRSNDGRADPWGGFWIGTMSKTAEAGVGTIYRYYRGELRALFPGITIPNAISFTPGGGHAYFADTIQQKVWRQPLSEAHGWPEGDPEVFLDHSVRGLNPDGAVVDQTGNLWCAEWGGGRVAVYDTEGQEIAVHAFDAANTSCPAFGGEALADLYCTTARQKLGAETLADGRAHGVTFVAHGVGKGQAEHQVIL